MTKLIIAAALLLSVASPALADHGRRAQVDRRLDSDRARINAGIRDGSLTRREASQLRREMHTVRRDERRAAADGRITRAEQARLDRETARLSRHIHRERTDAARR